MTEAAAHRARYVLADIPVTIECSDPETEAETGTILSNFGLRREQAEAGSGAGFSLRFTDAGPEIPPDARLVSQQFGIDIYTAGGAVRLRAGRAAASLAPCADGGAAQISAFRQAPPPLRRDLLLHSVFFLLRWRGVYALHAACVASDGAACVIAGPGGSGKSTLAFSLLRRGWKFLSDDVILLRLRSGEVEALPVRTDLLLHLKAAGRYPDVARDGLLSIPVTSDSKLRLDIPAMYPAQVVRRCVPRFLLFPEIADVPDSRLSRMSKADALARLLPQSALVLAEPARVPQHLEMLKQLVNQCDRQSLRAGRDLERDPGLIVALLSGARGSAHDRE